MFSYAIITLLYHLPILNYLCKVPYIPIPKCRGFMAHPVIIIPQQATSVKHNFIHSTNVLLTQIRLQLLIYFSFIFNLFFSLKAVYQINCLSCYLLNYTYPLFIFYFIHDCIVCYFVAHMYRLKSVHNNHSFHKI